MFTPCPLRWFIGSYRFSSCLQINLCPTLTSHPSQISVISSLLDISARYFRVDSNSAYAQWVELSFSLLCSDRLSPQSTILSLSLKQSLSPPLFLPVSIPISLSISVPVPSLPLSTSPSLSPSPSPCLSHGHSSNDQDCTPLGSFSAYLLTSMYEICLLYPFRSLLCSLPLQSCN